MTTSTEGRGKWSWQAVLTAWMFTAWLIALLSTLGALFVGEVMGQTPCVLCWYQRVFMFPLAVVLAVACYVSDSGAWRYVLPLAALGWLMAAYHVLLFAGVVPEAIEPCGAGPSCTSGDMTVLGGLPLPVLSLGAFSAIIILMLLVRKGSAK